MLSKKNRADKKTIERIFREGLFVSSPNLTFKFIKTNDNKKQISFITPKTASKKAVFRNLLRRRGYFVLRNYFNKLPNGLLGAFVFGKKSNGIFGGKKNKTHNPIANLDNEIKIILNKIN